MIDFSPADRFVHRLRLDFMVGWSARPHRLRWWPLVPVLLCAAGTIAAMSGREGVGNGLAVAGVGLAGMIRIWGPVRSSDTIAHPLDERERLLRLKSNAIAFAIVSFAGMAIPLWMLVGEVLPIRRPDSIPQWLTLCYGLATLSFVLPPLVASWMLPSMPADEEE